MHHIIYLSWATVPFTEEQLQQLLVRTRQRNKELAVTGMLLYGNEQFLQVLEGEEKVVQAVYAQIRRDARHDNILTFANKPIKQRTFTNWAMAFQSVNPQQLEQVVGYVQPADVALDATRLATRDLQLLELLRSFTQP